MSYVIQRDFKKLIQTDNLAAIIGSDFTLLEQAIRAAETEVTSYLIQKFDLTREFMDLQPWSPGTAYKALNRVYLDGPAYSGESTYALNDLTLQTGNVYICIHNIASGEVFDPTHWTKLGSQYDMFFVALPNPEFNFTGNYKIGDLVWWKDKGYTCAMATASFGHEFMLQYPSYGTLPPVNVVPDDPVGGLKAWGTGTPYALTPGTLPTDATKWTAGDNRNAQLVNCIIDVTLYTLHSRIAPRNIPELRVKRYDDVIKWLKNAAQGLNITAALPVIQPAQGGRIRFDSQPKKLWNY